MSEDNEASDTNTMQRCASCGTTGGDDIKLKKCTACHLVKYCSVKCQKDHWSKHKRECKKRAAELKDEILFKQPESSHYGDCPICCLPLPIDHEISGFYTCCSKRICDGCDLANQKREIEGRLQANCPFCRKALPETEEESMARLIERIEANDPFAICEMGTESYHGGDYRTAFEYFTRAVALGDVHAHYQLSTMYHAGQGVEKDKKKWLYHLKEAAIGGHPLARHNLGLMEAGNGQYDRAVKHFIIGAKLGYEDSLKCVKDLYKDGYVSKEEFAAALRGYKAAVDATKSPQRGEAAVFYKSIGK